MNIKNILNAIKDGKLHTLAKGDGGRTCGRKGGPRSYAGAYGYSTAYDPKSRIHRDSHGATYAQLPNGSLRRVALVNKEVRVLTKRPKLRGEAKREARRAAAIRGRAAWEVHHAEVNGHDR